MLEGSAWRPGSGETCRNLLRPAGEARGVESTSDRRSSRCIYPMQLGGESERRSCGAVTYQL